MTPTPGTTDKHSILYMLAHDEWCSHDEADDGIPCDCHLSAIASLREKLSASEQALQTAERAIRRLIDNDWINLDDMRAALAPDAPLNADSAASPRRAE